MVLITRPLEESLKLQQLCNDNGINSVILPTLIISPLHPVFRNKQYDIIIFISKNAVKYGLNFLTKQHNYLLIAIGSSTAKALNNKGFHVDYYPDHNASSASLLSSAKISAITRKKILIIRGVGGSEMLKHKFEENNNQVEYLEVYERVINNNPNYVKNFIKFIKNKQKIIVITSIEIFEALIVLTNNVANISYDTTFIVISLRIKKYLKSKGFVNVVMSETTNHSIVMAIKRCINS